MNCHELNTLKEGDRVTWDGIPKDTGTVKSVTSWDVEIAWSRTKEVVRYRKDDPSQHITPIGRPKPKKTKRRLRQAADGT